MTETRLGPKAEASLERAAAMLGFSSLNERALSVFRVMADTWYERPASQPFWVGLLDRTPFELAAQFPPHSRVLRFTCEPRGDRPSLVSYWDAGVDTMKAVADHLKWDFAPMREILSLLRPREDVVLDDSMFTFANGLGASFNDRGDLTVKVYLTLGPRGNRVPLADVLRAAHVPKLAHTLDHIESNSGMIALNMTSRGFERIKVYSVATVGGASVVDHLEQLGSLTADYRPGDAREFLEYYAPDALIEGAHCPFVASTLHAVEDRWDRLTVTGGYEADRQPSAEVLLERSLATLRHFEADEKLFHDMASLATYQQACILSMQRKSAVPIMTLYVPIPMFEDARDGER